MIEQIRQSIEEELDVDRLDVQGDGGRYDIVVVSDAFRGASRVKKQQLVYAAIRHLIADGSVHAVTITAQTPEEAAGPA